MSATCCGSISSSRSSRTKSFSSASTSGLTIPASALTSPSRSSARASSIRSATSAGWSGWTSAPRGLVVAGLDRVEHLVDELRAQPVFVVDRARIGGMTDGGVLALAHDRLPRFDPAAALLWMAALWRKQPRDPKWPATHLTNKGFPHGRRRPPDLHPFLRRRCRHQAPPRPRARPCRAHHRPGQGRLLRRGRSSTA